MGRSRSRSTNRPTADEVRSVLDYDPETGIFSWRWRNDATPQWNGRHPGTPAGTWGCSHGYLVITIWRGRYLAHHLAWLLVHGKWPEVEIDHRDMNRSNNRIGNLREAGQSNNGANQNKRSNNTSGYKGVVFDKARGRWKAQVKVNYKTIHLGRFDTAAEAAKSYDRAAKEHFGEFAALNFED